MKSNSMVSVIIIFLNAAGFIRESIESVLAQTYSNWELLLVDDGSDDGSTEIANDYANRDSRISYLEHPMHLNMGTSASRNLGIRHAKGEFLAFLDADDLWLPQKLDKHVKLLESHPQVGMLFGSCLYWFSWTGREQDRTRDYMPRIRARQQTLFPPKVLLPLLLEGRMEIPPPCSILVRSEMVRKISGFEESFYGMYDDQAFYSKICMATSILATTDCLAWYRQHPSSIYSTAIRSGRTQTLHFNFLKWLDEYCRDHHMFDRQIREALQRQLWLYDPQTSWKIPGLSPNTIRWIKKWILRLEAGFLPRAIRTRIWTTD